MQCPCGSTISQARIDLGLSICFDCADTPLLRGAPDYGHKTGAWIQIMNQSAWADFKKKTRRKGKRSCLGNVCQNHSTISHP